MFTFPKRGMIFGTRSFRGPDTVWEKFGSFRKFAEAVGLDLTHDARWKPPQWLVRDADHSLVYSPEDHWSTAEHLGWAALRLQRAVGDYTVLFWRIDGTPDIPELPSRDYYHWMEWRRSADGTARLVDFINSGDNDFKTMEAASKWKAKVAPKDSLVLVRMQVTPVLVDPEPEK